MRKLKYIMCATIALATGAVTISADDDQSDIRQNPTIELGRLTADIEYPSFINKDANHINMNGADWLDLQQIFALADICPVTIVHIGDSHLQADMGTAVTRQRLGKVFDHQRGRGLIIPFKLAGTNQPVDYSITSRTSFAQSRLLKLPWPTKMGFTGIGISPAKHDFDLSVTTEEFFDELTIYFSGDTLQLLSAIANGSPVPYITNDSSKALHIHFAENFQSVDLRLKAPSGTAIHGVNASLGDTGLAYHVIGNNGAAFSSYTGIGNVGNDISEFFEPDLIILSLGTNEAFGKISERDFRNTIDALVSELKMANPDAAFLLVTPQECHRRTGRRRRKSFSVNANVKRLRNVILDYARDNGIPVYDWYKVAGGDGSSYHWISGSYMNTDHIHLTRAGYVLHGNLFTDALLECLAPQN